MKQFILVFVFIFLFSFTVFADDPPAEEWNLEQDLEGLYNDGLISDDVMAAAEEGILIDGAIPTETASYSGNSNLDSSISDLELEQQIQNKEMVTEPGESLKALSPIPSSGSAYSDPTLISVEYAEDAEQGSLLEVIYGLLGKPVKAYHYRWQSSNQGYNVYSVQVLDYDIPWIASFLLLMLVIYCIFKCGGALLSKL